MADQWGGQQEQPQQPQDSPGWSGGETTPNWPPPGDQTQQLPPYAAGPPAEAGYGTPPSYVPPSDPGYGAPPNYAPGYPPPNYPPNYGYGPPPPPQQTGNGAAIAGFILAFLLAPLGLVFSIIGLRKADKVGGTGRSLAIAGIIISALDLVAAGVLIATLGVSSKPTVVASNAASHPSSAASSAAANSGFGSSPSPSSTSTDAGTGLSDPGCTSAESSFQSVLSKIQTDETKLSTDEAASDPNALQTDLAAFTTDVQGIKTALDSALAQAQHQSVKDAIQAMDTDTNTVLTGLQAIEKGDTSQLSDFTDAAGRLGSDGDALDSLCSSL